MRRLGTERTFVPVIGSKRSFTLELRLREVVNSSRADSQCVSEDS